MFYFPCPQHARDKGNVTKSPMTYALSFLTFEVFFFFTFQEKEKLVQAIFPEHKFLGQLSK